MKHLPQKTKKKRGFTVLEMTMAMALALGIAGALVGLLQQQISFTKALGNFSFLRDDAPQINTLLTNIINKSDSYRIYPSLADAQSMTGAVRSGGNAIRLRFRAPDGGSDHAIVAFEIRNSEEQLNYFFKPSRVGSWPASPTWTISKKPDLVTFDNTTGILLVTLNGPHGEEISYAGNPD